MEHVSILERQNQLRALNVSEDLIPFILQWEDKHISIYISNVRNGDNHQVAFNVEERLISIEKETTKSEKQSNTVNSNNGCGLWIFLFILALFIPPLFLVYFMIGVVVLVVKAFSPVVNKERS